MGVAFVRLGPQWKKKAFFESRARTAGSPNTQNIVRRDQLFVGRETAEGFKSETGKYRGVFRVLCFRVFSFLGKRRGPANHFSTAPRCARHHILCCITWRPFSPIAQLTTTSNAVTCSVTCLTHPWTTSWHAASFGPCLMSVALESSMWRPQSWCCWLGDCDCDCGCTECALRVRWQWFLAAPMSVSPPLRFDLLLVLFRLLFLSFLVLLDSSVAQPFIHDHSTPTLD